MIVNSLTEYNTVLLSIVNVNQEVSVLVPIIIAVVALVAIIVLVAIFRFKINALQKNESSLETNVTELKLIGDQFIEAEEKVKFFSDQPLVGIVMIQNGSIKFVNKAAAAIVDFPEEELMQWSQDDILNIVYEEDREEVRLTLFPTTPSAEQKITHCVSRITTKFQTIKWIEHYSRQLAYKNKSTTVVVFKDITELRQVEEQVSIFKRFAESSGQGLITLDKLGHPIFVNNSLCSIVSADSPRDILSRNITDFYPPKLRSKVIRQIIPEVLSKGQWYGELPLVTSSGKLVSTVQTFFKISDEGGLPQHVALVVSDISDKKQAQEELMFTKNYIKNVLHSLQSMIVSIDSEFKITQWNQTAQSFVDYPAESVLTSSLFEVVPFLVPYKSMVAKVIKTREKEELFREEVVLKDHTSFLNISCCPITNDYMDGVVIRIDDVTELEFKNEQIRQIQKMETVGKLAGGMAHDFNNILGGIKNSVSIIKYLLKSDNPNLEKINASIDLADEATNRATDMIGEVLELSQKGDVEVEPVDLNNTLKHVMLVCQKTLNKKIHINYSGHDDVAMIEGDSSKLEIALLNICRNAEHAMVNDDGSMKGGELTIALEIINADKHFCSIHPEARATYYWIIRITDNGVGLDTKVISKIFDPFFSTKKGGKGAGLGLSMVYNIIRQHRGFIDVYSEIGIGTTFNIFLPELIDSDEFFEDTRREEEELMQGSGTVLVVDDEALIRLTATSILEECGYSILTAENGQKGVDVFKEHKDKVDVILLDMAMPVMSGKEAFIELRAIKPDVKIIMASGFKQDYRLREVKNLGAEEFIHKPYSMINLARRIKAVIEK